MSLISRRMLMKIHDEKKWDYELYPEEIDSEGYGNVPFLKIDVNKGDIITILYFMKPGNTGYLYDMRGCGGKYLIYAPSGENTLNLTIESDGWITFSGHYYSQQNYQQDIFVGKYIKIKIN